MGLYKEWEEKLSSLNQKELASYLSSFDKLEMEAYKDILKEGKEDISILFEDFAEKYSFDHGEAAAFLKGINESIEPTIELESLGQGRELNFKIAWPLLYQNMHKAKADYLYNLGEWDNILGVKEREKLVFEFRKSMQAKRENEVGRNDPCPCGSGKKYKKCCG